MSEAERLTTGDLVLDGGSREVFLRGEPLALTRLEFEVLAYLLRHRGRAVPRQELLDGIWGEGYSPDSNVVDVVVASLRRKLGDDRRRPGYIITVPGVGYRTRDRARAEAARPRRWLLYSLTTLVGSGLVAGLILAFVVFRSGDGEPSTAAVTGTGEGGEIVFVIETRSTHAADMAGDCRSEDMTLSGVQSAGTVSGDLTGTVESDFSGTFFFTAGCLTGAGKGMMALVDESGDRLETAWDSVFSIVQLQPPPAPSATEGSDVLTVVGGTGKFANAQGYGTCQTTGLIEYEVEPLSMRSAGRSRCRLTLTDAGTLSSHAALVVRLVANPTSVGIVGSPDPLKPAATSVLVLYRNEGERDLTDFTLTLLPVEGVIMKAVSRMGGGEPNPSLRTWRLPDLRSGERQVFDFSVQFESTELREVPLVVRLSSPDMEEAVESEPFIVEVE